MSRRIYSVDDNTLPAIGAALVAAGTPPDGLTLAGVPDAVNELGELFRALYNRSVTDQQCVRIIEKRGLNATPSYAFAYCLYLKNLVFGKTPKILEIGQASFTSCNNLKSIEITEDSNIHTIGFQAFNSCASLESVVFSKLVNEIDRAFQYCAALKNIKYRSAFTIKGNCFTGSTNMELWDFSEAEGDTIPILDATLSQMNAWSKLTVLVPVGWLRSMKQATNWVNMKDKIVCSLEEGNSVELPHTVDMETHMTLYINGEEHGSLDNLDYQTVDGVQCIGIKYDEGYSGGRVSIYDDSAEEWEGALIDNENDVLLPGNRNCCIHMELIECAKKEGAT